MSTGKPSGISKLAKEKNQRILMELVSQPGNDTCADCKAKAPRWASYNLGIFICVRCASVHRKIGTHITKVKSLTLDDWSNEQVENMKSIGNVKANQYWNPDEKKHPLPTNMEESERDSELEKYIRSKYEFQRFRDRSSLVAEKLGLSQILKSRSPGPSSQATLASSLPKRSRTAPIHSHSDSSSSIQSSAPPLPTAPALETRSFSSSAGPASNAQFPVRRSSFNPFPSSGSTTTTTSTQAPVPAPAPPPNQQASLTSSTFNDLISIQTPSLNSFLPLQYASPSIQTQSSSQSFQTPLTTGMQSPTSTFSPSPFGPSVTGSSMPASSNTTNPYASLSVTGSSGGGPFSGSSLPSAALPPNLSGFGQGQPSSLNAMPTGAPNVFQQPFNTASAPNPFTQMQMQAQQYSGTPLTSNTTASSFFSPQQLQMQQQQSLQTGMFQSSSAFSVQAQQAQQIFQGMAAGGAGASPNNPFAQSPCK